MALVQDEEDILFAIEQIKKERDFKQITNTLQKK